MQQIEKSSGSSNIHQSHYFPKQEGLNPFNKNPSRFGGLKTASVARPRERSFDVVQLNNYNTPAGEEETKKDKSGPKGPLQHKILHFGEDSKIVNKIIENANTLEQKRSAERKQKSLRNRSLGPLDSVGVSRFESIGSPVVKMMVVESFSGASHIELNDTAKSSSVLNLNSFLGGERAKGSDEIMNLDIKNRFGFNENSNIKSNYICNEPKDSNCIESDSLTSNNNLINLGIENF
jgi:hypothetical protein